MWTLCGLTSICCCLAAVVSMHAVSAHRAEDSDFGNYLEEERDQANYQQQLHAPDFITIGQKYSVAIGSTIVLPCKINASELQKHFVLAWKRDIAVLTAGDVKVTMNARIHLMPSSHNKPGSGGGGGGGHNGGASSSSSSASSSSSGESARSYNLEIQNVRAGDAGDYVCQIGTLIPKEIVHSLEVLVPPKITYVAPQNKLDVSKGTAIKLECRASGKPAPAIIWSRKNNVMPNGEANITNNILEIMHADRHTVGHYRCTADNRVGQPDHRDIFVNVLYAPEIEVEHNFVHTGIGHETQLICIVHAEPTPQVIWYKDTTQLGVTEQHSQQSRGNRFALIIRNVTLNDLGNYTCQASNQLGKDRAVLTLSGIPSMCEFVDSPRVSNYHDQYNISWTVQSYETILEYRLYYRRQRNHSNNLNSKSHQQNYENNYIPERHYPISSSSLATQYVEPQQEWEDVVIIPPMSHYGGSSGHVLMNGLGQAGFSSVDGIGRSSSSSNVGAAHHHKSGTVHGNSIPRHRTSYVITKLRYATNYEVRVQARNLHGWNKLSATFYFSTQAYEADALTNSNGADFRPLTLQSSASGETATTVPMHWIAIVSTTLAAMVSSVRATICT